MKTQNNRVLSIFLISLALLFAALPFYRPHQVPVFLLLFGRIHPVILHFPIVLIILAFLFELGGKFGYLKKSRPVIRIILLAAVVTSSVVVGAGFFLFASGDYSGELMELHYWAGAWTGVAITLTTVLYFLYLRTERYYGLYLGGLVLSTMIVGYTSHLGGSITHGKDFLTAYLPAMMNEWKQEEDKPESDMLVYQDVINPILEFKCASCHNATRAKGGYIITPFQNLNKPGESGHPPVKANFPDSSELFKRITLPETHEDHMPPEGKTPLSVNEITLLRYWITSGASEAQPVAEARKSEIIAPVMKDLLAALTNYHRKSTIAKMQAESLQYELQDIAQKLSVTIHSDNSADGEFFTLAMNFPPSPFADDQIKTLMPYADHFSKVSVVATGISDDALYYIGQMRNVRELYLQKTALTGSGLVYLQSLPNLEILNLSFTQVDDNALIDLLKFPRLREVYLYRTKTNLAVIEAIRKNKPGLKIVLEEGPYL